MSVPIKFAFYIKLSLILVGIYALVSILFIAQSILVPLLFSIIFGILISPVVNWLTQFKINRVIAIFIVLFTLMLVIGTGIILFAKQIIVLSNSYQVILEKFYSLLDNGVKWITQRFDISIDSVSNILLDTKHEIIIKTKTVIGPALLNMKDIIFVCMVMPVYIFMIVFYQPLLLEFIHKLFGRHNQEVVHKIVSSTKFIIQRYLMALLIEASIIATLNTIGLFALGIPYAILLGIFGAILNIIPYLGGLIAMMLYVIIALVTKDQSIYMLYVVILYTIIQLVDNNLIMPKLVGSRVKINALVAIIAVVLGGSLWGIPGMFISLPLVAITKLICNNIESLKPWGFLLGDTMPAINIFKNNK